MNDEKSNLALQGVNVDDDIKEFEDRIPMNSGLDKSVFDDLKKEQGGDTSDNSSKEEEDEDKKENPLYVGEVKRTELPSGIIEEWQDQPLYSGQVKDGSRSMPGCMRFSSYKTFFLDLSKDSDRREYDKLLNSEENGYCNFEVVSNRTDFDQVHGRYIALVVVMKYKFAKQVK